MKNVGQTDKIIRIILAFVMAGVSYFGVVEGILSWVLYIVAVVFLLTALVGFCPIYKVFGKSTCQVK